MALFETLIGSQYRPRWISYNEGSHKIHVAPSPELNVNL
jgi:hypothetical protein